MTNLHSVSFFLFLVVLVSPIRHVAGFLPAQQHHQHQQPFSTTPYSLSTTTRLTATIVPQDHDNNKNTPIINEEGLGDVPIPTTGVSIQDEIDSNEKDRFETDLIPIHGFNKVAAQLITTTTSTTSKETFEPVRYLISLSPPPPSSSDPTEAADQSTDDDDDDEKIEQTAKATTDEATTRDFVLLDIPPYSPKLVAKMKEFMGDSSYRLLAMLVTSRDAIHFDDAPAVYRMRRTDLEYWKNAFPGLEIVAYRLDIPRDCRDSMTQVLDGYGPFAACAHSATAALGDDDNGDKTHPFFVETGRPLTYNEWDHDVAQDILRGRKPVPDLEDEINNVNNNDNRNDDGDDEVEYTKEAIRSKEQNKKILAVYTPGHSFGSISYVFPDVGLCCSGFTIPVEDTREDDNPGMDNTGPALDCRGYITTNRGGVAKQMESAKHLVHTYSDRFRAVLPSRGDPLIFANDEKVDVKKKILLDILSQYEKIGRIYEELGITSSSDEDLRP